MQEIVDLFEKYFDIVLAKTPELVEAAKRLRYQVYCLEHQFERREDCHGGIEEDAYDGRAVHGVLQYKKTLEVIATVRLVRPDARESSAPFPVEEHCRGVFESGFDPMTLPRAQVAEISRFAVSKEFRKRLGEAQAPHGLTEEGLAPRGDDERRLVPHLTLGLFRAIVEMSRDHGITHWYAVMEPILIRSLRRFGIDFPTIGGVIEYHGKRQPCLAVATDLLRTIHERNPAVWGFITQGGELWPLEGPSSRITH